MDRKSNERILFRILYILKRLTDNWGELHIQEKEKGFKMAYVPVFISISELGTTNNEIAHELHITKMASSKILKELSKLGLISSQKNSKDARSEKIFLTKKGTVLLNNIKDLSDGLLKEYRNILGEKGHNEMITSLISLQKYHENIKELEKV